MWSPSDLSIKENIPHPYLTCDEQSNIELQRNAAYTTIGNKVKLQRNAAYTTIELQRNAAYTTIELQRNAAYTTIIGNTVEHHEVESY